MLQGRNIDHTRSRVVRTRYRRNPVQARRGNLQQQGTRRRPRPHEAIAITSAKRQKKAKTYRPSPFARVCRPCRPSASKSMPLSDTGCMHRTYSPEAPPFPDKSRCIAMNIAHTRTPANHYAAYALSRSHSQYHSSSRPRNTYDMSRKFRWCIRVCQHSMSNTRTPPVFPDKLVLRRNIHRPDRKACRIVCLGNS